MLRKAVDQSSVVPPSKPRFEEKRDNEADPSTIEGGWTLNDAVGVSRSFDVHPVKRWPS